MEKLPIQYFDTHAHGDIMRFTINDIDTLRQVIPQSIPEFLFAVSIVSVFFSMIVMSVPLTLVTLMMVVVMQFALQKIMRKSGRSFSARQLGKEKRIY